MKMENKKSSVPSDRSVRIAKHSRHRSKTRRKTIHTTIRSLKKGNQWHHLPSVKNKVHTENSTKRQHHQQNNGIILKSESVLNVPENEHQPSYVFENTSLNRKEAWPDRIGMTIDHHRKPMKKKPNYIRPCIIALVILILIIGVVIAVVLVTIPSKSKITTNATPVLRWNTTGITIAGITNVSGNASYLLYLPYDVTLDYPNTFYVADQGNNRIGKFSVGSFNGATVAGCTNGTWGTTSSYLRGPSRVLIDSNNNVYVSDTSNHRIQFWMNNATSGTTLIGGYGSANNQLINPYGLVRDPDTSTLYIADYGNHRVISYAKNATSGTVVAGGNGSGLNTNQLNHPRGLYLDTLSNSLVIVNYDTPNIVRWVLGASNWTLIADNVNISASTTMASPTDVTFDPMGNMYVADSGNNRILMFPIGKRNGITIAGRNGTMLNSPYSIKLDNQLHLYVADTNNDRIEKFLRY